MGTKKLFRIIIIALIIFAALVWGVIMSMGFIRPYIMPSMFLTDAAYGTMRELAEVRIPSMPDFAEQPKRGEGAAISGTVLDISESPEFTQADITAAADTASGKTSIAGRITTDTAGTVDFTAEVDSETTAIAALGTRIELDNAEFGADWNRSASARQIFGFTLPEELPKSENPLEGVNVYDFYNNIKAMTKGARVRRDKTADMSMSVKCYDVYLDAERVRDNVCAIMSALSIDTAGAEEYFSSAQDELHVRIWADSDGIVKAIADNGSLYAWFDGTGGRIRDNIKFGGYIKNTDTAGFAARIISRDKSAEVTVETADGEHYGFSRTNSGDTEYLRYKSETAEAVVQVAQDKDSVIISVPYSEIAVGGKKYVFKNWKIARE